MTPIFSHRGRALLPFLKGILHPVLVHDTVEMHRIDPKYADRFPNDFVRLVERQGGGARLTFRTTASRIELKANTSSIQPKTAPPDPVLPFILTINGENIASFTPQEIGVACVDPLTGIAQSAPAEDFTWNIEGLLGEEKDVTIWLPYNQEVHLQQISTDAELFPINNGHSVWLHHGSSISHGAIADNTLDIWPIVASEKMNLQLINLGFSGNAVLDPFVAQTIASAKPNLITLKIGINVINSNCFTNRTFGPALHGFLDIIRATHEATPIVLATALACPMVENVPGPTFVQQVANGRAEFFTQGTPIDRENGCLSLADTRREIEKVFSVRKDPNLYLVDGLSLLSLADLEVHPLPDGLHPDSALHRLIGERFAEKVDSLGLGL